MREIEELERSLTHMSTLIQEGPLYDHFAGAIRSIRQTSAHVQEQSHVSKNKEKVHAIEEAWGMKLTQPGRIFIREVSDNRAFGSKELQVNLFFLK